MENFSFGITRVGYRLGEHQMHPPLPVGELEEMPGQRRPSIGRHAEELRRRAIEGVRDPDRRRLHRFVAGVGDVVIAEHVAVEAAGADMVDPVLRIPVPLLIGHPKRAVGLDTHPIGRPEATGHDLRRRPVRGDFQERAMVGHDGRKGVAGGLCVIEITGGVGLEAHRKLMEMLGHLMIVVDRVVAVDLAVVVEVDKPHDPVATANMDRPTDDFQPQWLKQPRGNPLPREDPLRIEQPRHPPDVAIPGAHGGHVAVAPEEVEAGEPQLRVPGICVRGNEPIDRKRIVGVAALHAGLEELRPERPRWLADAREGRLDRRDGIDRCR